MVGVEVQMSIKQKIIMNAVLFQLGWFVCILFPLPWALVVVLTILVLHHRWLVADSREWVVVILVAALGVLVDQLMLILGVLSRVDGHWWMPTFLLLLWVLFGTTVNHCFAWLRQRLILAMFLGAIAGPMSYYGGAQLNQMIDIGDPTILSLLLLMVLWAMLFPVLLLIGLFGSKYHVAA